MAKQFSIEINDMYKGIGASPLVGYSNVRNLNTRDRLGMVYPNYKLIADGSGYTLPDDVDDFVVLDGDFYALVGDNIWKRGASAWAEEETAFARGSLTTWRDYIVGYRLTTLRLLNAAGTDYSITVAAGSSPSNAMCVVLSDALYVVADDEITKISEADGETFDPTDSGTYVLEPAKLKLPTGVEANCVTTWNNLLVIGGDDGNIYTWNGVSDYFADISTTVESEIKRLITVNRRVYAQAGLYGNWYRFDGISVTLIKEIPDSLIRKGELQYIISPQGVAEVDGKIYFAMNASTNSGDIAGIYSFDLADYSMVCEDEVTVGNDTDVTLGALIAKGEQGYYAGWKLNGGTDTFGINVKSTSSRYDSEVAYFETALFDLTNDTNEKRTLSKSTVIFAEALASSDEMNVYYREYLSDSWTLHQTIELDGLKKVNLTSFPALDSIQLKVTLDAAIKLKSIILK